MDDSHTEDEHAARFAVIGMAGRFPGARDIDELWARLQGGQECISRLSDDELRLEGVPSRDLDDPHYVKARGVLEGIEFFDADLFGYLPAEARWIDPQQRLLLECARETLEGAGYLGPCAEQIGVFACASRPTYLAHLARLGVRPDDAALQAVAMGNDNDFLASRVSYRLDLRGPSVVVQTACSSSLVCVHLACQSLLSGESDLALAGGVSISLPQIAGYRYREGGITSRDGRCRAFDARASGTVRGHGVGVVLLRRLSDALRRGDSIRAVIRGSATNNDGRGRVGFTAPGVDGQAAAVAEAMAVAGVDPRDVSYVEAHGSGTALGDPIEIAALTRAFRSRGGDGPAPGSCPVGSVKTNIGHLDAAAGIAGLIKTALCLEHRRLPPSLGYASPGPDIDFSDTPFFVNSALADWTSGAPRIAGVSSFGLGGTNAHVVLEEAPPPTPRARVDDGTPRLLALSAGSEAALETGTSRLAEHLRAHPALDLADVAHTLQRGREALGHRRVAVCRNIDDAAELLASRTPGRVFTGGSIRRRPPSVAFMFSGLGDQAVDMGRDLYRREPAFQQEVDRCAELLRAPLGLDLREVMYPSSQPPDAPPDQAPGHGSSPADRLDLRRMIGRARAPVSEAQRTLDRTALAHPALFVLGYALAATWRARGVTPRAVLGYSIGEYVAAAVAGVFSLEDALSLVAERARLIQALPAGAMCAVPLPATELRPLLDDGLTLAGINGRSLCVVSGPEDAVNRLEDELADRGIACMRLQATHAFHSPMMAPAAEALRGRIEQLERRAPGIPFISGLTGTWITDREATDPAYWAAQLCSPVLLEDGLRTLREDPDALLLELGPGQTLCQLATAVPRGEDSPDRPVLSSLPSRYRSGSPDVHFLQTLGRLWTEGCPVSWPPGGGRKVPLPTYPFERRRCWAAPRGAQPAMASRRPAPGAPTGAPRDDAPSPRPSNRSGAPAAVRTGAAPRTDEERIIAASWERAFGVDGLGVHDDFFELGGHSLLAVQVLYDLRERHGLELTLLDLIQHPTVAGLAGRTLPGGDDGDDRGFVGMGAVLEQGAAPAGPRASTVERLTEFLTRHGAAVLGREPGAAEEDASLGREDLVRLAPHVIWAARRELGLRLFPHEILACATAAAMARLIVEATRAVDPGDARSQALHDRIARDVTQASRTQRAHRKMRSPVFILSAARSGSTLVRIMLAGHPELFCPPELHLLMFDSMGQRRRGLPSDHFGQGLQRALLELRRAGVDVPPTFDDDTSIPQVYRQLQAAVHPRTLVDKSPSYARRLETLHRAEALFAAPRYLHLTRHPHAVIDSYVQNRFQALGGEAGDPYEAAEHHWAIHNHNILQFLSDVPDHRRRTVRFEDLVQRPEAVMRSVCGFLAVPFSSRLLDPYGGGRMADGPGDPGFHERGAIDAGPGRVWQEVSLPRPLAHATRDIVRQMHYDLPESTGTGDA